MCIIYFIWYYKYINIFIFGLYDLFEHNLLRKYIYFVSCYIIDIFKLFDSMLRIILNKS